MNEKEELRLRYLKAKAEKEELEIVRLQSELKRQEKKVPFYKNPALYKTIIGGIAIAISFSGYFRYVFLNELQKLEQERDTEVLVSRQQEALHKAQLAKSDFLQEKLRQEAQSAKNSLKLVELKMIELQKQSETLQAVIADLPEQQANTEKVKAIKETTEKNSLELKTEIANTQDSTHIVEGVQEALSKNESYIEGDTGWIYIGYYPNSNWNYRNIDITSGLPNKEQPYTITNNVNVRNRAPKFSLFGYSFGDIVGTLVRGQKIEVINVKEVGRSKVWAEVKLFSNSNN